MPRILFSAEAKRDLQNIRTYLSEDQECPMTARHVLGNILESIEGLSSQPLKGDSLAPNVGFETNYRYIRASGYLVFYRCEVDHIYIDRVLYGIRDYINVLYPGQVIV